MFTSSTRNTVYPSSCDIEQKGPVLRLGAERIDVQLPEVAFDAWGGQNQRKLPWDKDPEFCEIVQLGMRVDNVLSMTHTRDAIRIRRLINAPFAKKFLLDQEHISSSASKI